MVPNPIASLYKRFCTLPAIRWIHKFRLAPGIELSWRIRVPQVYNQFEAEGLASNLLVPGRTALAIVLPICYPPWVWAALA